jgi:hypothetical protein
VRVRHGLDTLLEATDDSPFVRWEVTQELATTWWQVGGGAGFRRIRPSGRSAFNLIGTDDGVALLIEHATHSRQARDHSKSAAL